MFVFVCIFVAMCMCVFVFKWVRMCVLVYMCVSLWTECPCKRLYLHHHLGNYLCSPRCLKTHILHTSAKISYVLFSDSLFLLMRRSQLWLRHCPTCISWFPLISHSTWDNRSTWRRPSPTSSLTKVGWCRRRSKVDFLLFLYFWKSLLRISLYVTQGKTRELTMWSPKKGRMWGKDGQNG